MKKPKEAPISVVTNLPCVRMVGENAKKVSVRSATEEENFFLVQTNSNQAKKIVSSIMGMRDQKIILSASLPDSYKNAAP